MLRLWPICTMPTLARPDQFPPKWLLTHPAKPPVPPPSSRLDRRCSRLQDRLLYPGAVPLGRRPAGSGLSFTCTGFSRVPSCLVLLASHESRVERGSTVPCINAATTMRARIVLIQPHLNATVMKPMFARQHGHLCSQFNRVHTDRTLRFALTVQHFLIHGSLGQRLDRILRGGRRRISVGVVLE